MSQINTNSINTNYPAPGVNNSTQGFRDNFTQIVGQLNTAANEITDLQSKAILKAALNNSTLNNDMANAVISNASVTGFRFPAYNLGNSLANTVAVNINQAPIQYGTVTGNVILQFTNWSPTNTESNVVVRFTYANANAFVQLPSNCISSNNDFGVTLLENLVTVGSNVYLSLPANADIMTYKFSSIDCGNTVTVSPINRPYQTTQVVTRAIPPTGLPGDKQGDVASGITVPQVSCTGATVTGNYVLAASTSGFYPDMPIIFTGNTDSSNSNVTVGNLYYVTTIASNALAFTISNTVGGTNVAVTANSTATFKANPASYSYICTGTYNASAFSANVTNTYSTNNQIKLSSNVSNIAVNAPIIFTGNVFGNIVANTVYYVKSVDTGNSNISIAYSRSNGIAGTTVTMANANGNISTTCYVGSDIWKRLDAKPW